MLPNCYMTPKILVKDPQSTLIERSVEFLQFQAKKETKQYTYRFYNYNIWFNK